MEERVTLNRKEQNRLLVLNKIEAGKITTGQAADVLGITLRHTRRLLTAYREHGAGVLAHGNRGRKPKHALNDELKRRVLALAESSYAGFNNQHFTELLEEREDIKLSRSSVRRILLGAGINSPRKRHPPKHRSRRERYPQEGMLLQIDASVHAWLEERGPELTLVGAIDDATGKVPYALFVKVEDSRSYFQLLQGIVDRCGIPMALYHDGHSIFQVNREPSLAEQLAGKDPITQFGRLMAELGITSISARSPQAKGRIERLWGTFQDRLVNELRLAGASTPEEANRVLQDFLVRYNSKFTVPAKLPGSVYRKAEGPDPGSVFCFKYGRVAGADNVVRWAGQRIQILSSGERASYARCKVEVHEQLDGSLSVYYQGRCLNTREAPAEAGKLRQSVIGVPQSIMQETFNLIRPPAKDHPWRAWVYR
jgi:transposase